MPEKNFDKVKYNYEYNKKNYKRHSINVRPDFDRKIEAYRASQGLSFNDFMIRCANYIITNKIDVSSEK